MVVACATLSPAAAPERGWGPTRSEALRRISTTIFANLGTAFAMAVGTIVSAPPATAADRLRDQLVALAAAESFEVVGLDRLEDEPTRPVFASPLIDRLAEVLEGYNYVLVRGADGGVARISIVGRPLPPGSVPVRMAVSSDRDGAFHVVETTLVGPNGSKLKLPLLIDTGATTVALPASLIPELGFQLADLADKTIRSVGGSVAAKVGALALVQVGAAAARDVAVAFVEDEKLGPRKLLGMSFLGRFHMSLDDRANRVTLIAR